MAQELEVAKYQFQSWARRGIAAHINEQDTLGDPQAAIPGNERASVPIDVSINSVPQPEMNFDLVGPSDVIGIQSDMIVRCEPRNWITDAEPNFLPFIEFYDEDFAWRYTPANPVGERLRPWLALFVLKETEFERDNRRLPLPVITIKSGNSLPSPAETWMFAHVHTEQEIPGGELSDLEQYLRSLREVTRTDPDKVYCRLLSPRHLDANTPYYAFLVPAFEGGRLSGIGRPTAGIPAQRSSWDTAMTEIEMPFYFDWYFRTGEVQDFESLVNLLKPRQLDKRIGIRSIDCEHPGFVKVDGEGRQRSELPPELPPAGPPIQGLEGALRTDRTESLPTAITPNEFQTELEILVNLPETIKTNLDASPGTDDEFLNDPVVTVPFYGQNHARQNKTQQVLLDSTKNGWYHDLNRDPRNRIPAGLGTTVVQKGQEKFMQKAWQQVEKVYAANRKIRKFQFYLKVSNLFSKEFFEKLTTSKLLAVTHPVHARVLGSPTTVRHQISESHLKAPVFSSAVRRLVRPAGKLSGLLDSAHEGFEYSEMVKVVNDGRFTKALDRGIPSGIPSIDDIAKKIQPNTFSPFIAWLINNRNWVLIIALLSLLVVGVASGAVVLPAIIAAAAIGGFFWLRNQGELKASADSLTDAKVGKAALENTPPRPNFAITLDGETEPAGPVASVAADEDSREAFHFRKAAIDLQERLMIRMPEKPALQSLDIERTGRTLRRAIDPRVSFPRRLSAVLEIPDHQITGPNEFVDVMAHPDLEEPMYAGLRDINKELLVPNLQLIPTNTISLLETNPRFIESYMVGLNHEMARELLWREYPTDQRGSYFRQFWDVKSISNPDTPSDAERLKDITKIHTWASETLLGDHKPTPSSNADVQPGDKQVVLVIRGDLLKRYPNTVIYAQKAIDYGHGNDVIRRTDFTPEQFDKELKFPLFQAEIDPDLRFFGFDLTIEKAKGQTESNDFKNDHRGWFFVIQEVPGEPRFGMDISYNPTTDADLDATNDPLDDWNNLAWNCFGNTEPSFVTSFPAPSFPRPDTVKLNAHQWASNAAEMAYILFQTPVMIAVHASEMLDFGGDD